MWPPEALEFLRELEDNNDRDWFKANRKRYDEHLVAPAKALAEQLGHLGEHHLFRPYNDTRFHMRPPIKEQLGVAIGYGGAGGFYFELSLDGLLVAAGMHHPASDQLERFRAVIGRRSGAPAGFENAARQGRRRPGSSSRRPSSSARRAATRRTIPRIDRLRLKELAVYRRHPLAGWLHKRECDKRVRAQLESARPLVKWLGENVGPSARSRG